jgi:hypothetical protein
MLYSKLTDGRYTSLYHRLEGEIDAATLEAELRDALDVIQAALFEFDDLPLILDARGCRFTHEDVRAKWFAAVGKLTLGNTRIPRVAVVGAVPEELFGVKPDSAWSLRSFTNLEEARAWIRP